MSISAENSAMDIGGGATIGAGMDFLTIVLGIEGRENQGAIAQNLWGKRPK